MKQRYKVNFHFPLCPNVEKSWEWEARRGMVASSAEGPDTAYYNNRINVDDGSEDLTKVHSALTTSPIYKDKE